jgi:hypothetical protein
MQPIQANWRGNFTQHSADFQQHRHKENPVAEETKTADEIVAEVKTAFDTKHDAVKEIAEKALAEAEKGIPLSATAKELADEAIVGMNEAKARLDELEQKVARRQASDDGSPNRSARSLPPTSRFKAFLSSKASKGRAGMEVKAIISSLTTAANGSAGDLIVPDRVPGVSGFR